MELLPLSPNLSPTSSPYITAPSSPKHLADDAPDFEIELSRSSCSTVAFNWQENPAGKPKSFHGDHDDDDDDDDEDYQDITFEFCVDQFQSFSLPAEELFDGGKIRTLEPPPTPQLQRANSPPDPSSISQNKRKIIWSSRGRSYDFSQPFEAGILRAHKSHGYRVKTLSFGGFSRLRSLLSFRRRPPPSSSSERGSTTTSTSSKSSTSFGSTGSSSSGSGSGWGTKYLSGSAHELDEGYGRVARDEVKSCLTPCKQRLLSCFVKKL